MTAFEGTGVNVTDVGKWYLGGALGSEGFLTKFAESKISEWTREIERLSDFARSQPHAAFAAFCHGVCHRWTYVTRVVPIAEECLQPLEKVIRMTFLPALTGQTAFNDEIRQLMALPPRHGGLGITNPVKVAKRHHASSVKICQPLITAIHDQRGDPFAVRGVQRQIKAGEKRDHGLKLKAESVALTEELATRPDLQRSILTAS